MRCSSSCASIGTRRRSSKSSRRLRSPALSTAGIARWRSRWTVSAGAAAATAASALPMPAIAQNAPIKVGLLTVKTGPLAAGGIHAEEGITSFLKDKNFTLSGRKIELLIADTGGSPAGAKTKAQELVERDKVNVVLGPFAAFELLATLDNFAQAKMPTLAFAGAEDVTQRKGNPYLTRTSYTSAQCLYPLADYLHTEMKLKTAATIADDFAFGY